ncbi:hypothetical protein PQX77_009309 [Marasmius sp. AFHP31]|nr:hypothetical protein PQX77_009309 [Marasmius sp. AFHP31]
MFGVHRVLVLASMCFSLGAAQDGYASLNGGTTGGAGGPVVVVSKANAFREAVLVALPVSGNHTTIQGIGTSGIINGGGLGITGKSNVIIRNLVINKVVADVKIFGADAVTIQNRSHNIWVDHNEFYSDLDHGEGYYDGQVDITDECDWITVSYNYFHDHYASSLVGGSPYGWGEGGHPPQFPIIRTKQSPRYRQVSCYLPPQLLEERRIPNPRFGPFDLLEFPRLTANTEAVRLGHVHVYNNYVENVLQGIHSRSNAQVMIEGNVFEHCVEPGKPAAGSSEI